jgi:protein SDA1
MPLQTPSWPLTLVAHPPPFSASQLAPSYPQLTASYPGELAAFLLQHHERLGADVRRSAVRSLVLLRNREVISSEE